MNEGFISSNEGQEAQEETFRKKLAQLPRELSQIWLLRYENLEDDDDDVFFQNFETFLNNRNRVSLKTLEIHPDTSKMIQEEILFVHESIRNTFGDPNYFLGNGRTAEVYTLPVAPHLCVKYITNQQAYNENNHMRVEYSFLDRLHAFDAAGVRTPRPYFIRIHPSEGHSYGMERIMGENLSRILEKPSENRELIYMLRRMNRKEVEKKLVSYIQLLHQSFKITHNDIAKRNIMVDQKGNLYIIDFGKAKQEEIGEDHNQYRNSDIARTVSEIRHFFQSLDKIDID